MTTENMALYLKKMQGRDPVKMREQFISGQLLPEDLGVSMHAFRTYVEAPSFSVVKFWELMEWGWTEAEIAKELNITPSRVSYFLTWPQNQDRYAEAVRVRGARMVMEAQERLEFDKQAEGERIKQLRRELEQRERKYNAW